MPLGKYSRVDGRKSSSSYGSTITIVVFVAVCMVGVWMMASPAVVPVQSSNVPQENNNEVKTTEAESNVENRNEATTSNGDGNQNTDDNKSQAVEEKQKQFEDNPGDLPEEATKSDSNAGLNQAEKKDTSSEVIGQNTEEPKLVNDEVKKEDKPINEPEKEEKKKTHVESQDSESRETNDSEKKFKEDSGKADEVKVEEKAEEKAEEKPEDKIEKTDEKEEEKLEDKAEKTEEKPEDKAEKTDEKAEEKLEDKAEEKTEDKAEKTEEKAENKTDETKKDEKPNEDKESSGYVFPSGAQSELSSEPTNQTGSFKTQATQSKKEKDAQQSTQSEAQSKYNWKVCKTSAGTDYIPCLDNLDAIKKLTSTKHYEHRERHCPKEAPTCLVPLPEGYQRSIEWPKSREKIWYHNVPHTKLAEVKGHQNWVKVSGEYLTFPGGGTQFKHGALHYIDFIQQSVPEIAWGNRTRVVLDVGCGVASFGGFLFDRNALTMSLAPKDEHEAQVQFALERGIPAISAVMGTTRLLYPARVFDAVHCARCRVPWHIEGGKLLLELNRLLRPGGFFIWSATPIYQKLEEDVEIWEAMKQLTMAMCWDLVSVTKDRINGVGIAVYRKPNSNECYEQRSKSVPPLCKDTDDPNAAWNVPLQACMHKLPVASSERGTQWPEQWPARAEKSPYWLSSSEVGVYGKPAPEDFDTDCKHWKRVFNNSYLKGMGINWSTVRNAMDMRAVYGGLAAAMKDLNVWVMNVVSIDAPDTLPIIYERGLFGIYHDWCESFSTYPRSYDLLHADHLFSRVKTKCNLVGLVAEVDRILRPEGKIIIRDTVEIITELETIFKSMQWDIRLTFSKDKEGLLCAQKSMWRPKEEETLTYSIA